jgi:hypothetical protein
MLPLLAGMLGTAPISDIAVRAAAVLAAPQLIAPVLTPAISMPKIVPTHYARAVVAVPQPHQIVARVTSDIGPIFIVTPDLSLTSADTAPAAEEPRICRRPQQLVGSHLSGPAVCLLQSEWDRLKEQNLVLMPDGRELVGSYEKRHNVSNPGCPMPNVIGGATTGMSSLFSVCY